MGTPNERPTVDESAASPERLGKVVPLRVAAQPPPPLEQLVEQTFRIAIGMTALASEVLAEAVARTLGREPFAEGEAPGDETARPASGVPLVAGAAIGVALEGAKWGARAATTMVRSAELFFSLLTSPGFVQEPLRQAGDRLGGFDARWREQRPRDEEAAAAFLRLLVPQVVDAALDQIDLNELVAERIELDRIIDGLDLDRVIAPPGHRRDRGPDRPRPHHRTHRRRRRSSNGCRSTRSCPGSTSTRSSRAWTSTRSCAASTSRPSRTGSTCRRWSADSTSRRSRAR